MTDWLGAGANAETSEAHQCIFVMRPYRHF